MIPWGTSSLSGIFRWPFSLCDEELCADWHGKVANVAGICEAIEAVDPTTLVERAGDHRWVFAVVEHAIACIEQHDGWRSSELKDFIKAESERPLPLVHFFEALAQTEAASGVKCVPWLSTRPGEMAIGVRIGERDVTVLSQPGPLYLEDSFPIAKSIICGQEYRLLDKEGKALASVDLHPSHDTTRTSHPDAALPSGPSRLPPSSSSRRGARGGVARDAIRRQQGTRRAWRAFNGARSWPPAVRQGLAAQVSEERRGRILGL